MITVGIDAGFGNVKVAWQSLNKKGKMETLDFPSRVKETQKNDPNGIMINGEYYNFGEADLVVDRGYLTKDNADTRLLLYKALLQVHKKTGETTFNIIMNCALDNYKLDKGQSVKNRMEEVREITIEERFKDKVTLKINNIVIMPECLSSIGLIKGIKLKDEEVIIIDCGTLNLQGIQIIKGAPQYATTFSTTYGMQSIYRGLADRIKVLEQGLGTDYAVQMYLEKTAKGEMEPIKTVEDVILNFLMDTVFKELNIQLKQIKYSMFAKFVFVGGGSITMKRFLETKFANKEIVFVENAYFSNSLGMQATGQRLFVK